MNALFHAIDSHAIASVFIVAIAIGFVWLYVEIDNTPLIDDQDNF
jgi:uncharacterized membrane protein